MVNAEWHYITHEKFGEELYDWSADPDQALNLADGHPAAEQLRAYLERQTGQSISVEE